MDPFDLDLNPAMNSGIFYHQTYSNDSLNLLDQPDFTNFGKQNEEDNFTQNFKKVFNLNSPDNKEESISEIDNLYNINNVDEFLIRFQNENLNNYYFKKDFDGIIYQIEKQFPFFFNEKNEELLYLIEKLRFFNLLKEKKIDEAKKLYQDKLLILTKEVKRQNWEIKNKFFIKLIKKPNLIDQQGDLQKKYYDQFTYELEKAIRIFLHEENDEQNKNEFIASSNNNINIYASSSSMDLDNLPKINYNQENKFEKEYKNKKSKDKETDDGEEEINLINKNIINNNEENNELDFDDFSTKEEFSDFEDELQPKISNENEEQKNSNIKESNGSLIKINTFINVENNIDEDELDPVNNNIPFFSNLSMSSFSKSHKSSYEIEINPQKEEEENECIINTSSKNTFNIIKEKNNFNEYKINFDLNEKAINIENDKTSKNKKNKENQKKNNKKEKDKNEQIIFNQLPFLNSFKPKYIKRETIDKKIIRTFKNFVAKENKEKRLELNNENLDYNFFLNLIYGNLLPPIDFTDESTGEIIKFNSFNFKFLLWFFSKKGVKDVYLHFINEKGKEFINDLSEHYELSLEEKSQLNNYISNFPFIFDLSLVNHITNGTEINHIYRTVDKNKKIQNKRRKKGENDLELRKNKSGSSLDLKRERSRSREIENEK